MISYISSVGDNSFLLWNSFSISQRVSVWIQLSFENNCKILRIWLWGIWLSEKLLNFDPPCFHQIFRRMKNMKMGGSLCFHDCTHTKAFLIIFLIKHEKNNSFPYRQVKLVNHFEIKCLVVCTFFCLCSVCRCVISSIKKIFFPWSMLASYIHT